MGKPFEKKSGKNRKTVTNQCDNAACEQKPLTRNPFFFKRHFLIPL